ncbi:MAG: DNA polymerase IV [bacterium]
MDRNIIHINISAFPVGVERAKAPALRERPVAVAAEGSSRAVVLALSREAYLEGVVKGMSVSRARRVCPGLRVIPPDFSLYQRAARAVFDHVNRYSPEVEPWRPGHLHADLTGTRRLFGRPVDVAARLQAELRDRFSLRNTVGVAGNKLVSRVASRVVRPRGVCDVFAGGEAGFLAPLDVSVLPGVGPKTRQTLADLNINTVGEVAAIPLEQLYLVLGSRASTMHRMARGIDETPVRTPRAAPLVREDETLAEDTNNRDRVLAVLYLLAERAGRRLRHMESRASALEVEILYTDHVRACRQARLSIPTNLDREIFDEAARLLERAWTRRTRLRCIALEAGDLVHGPVQLGLFDQNHEKDRNLCAALDAVRERFGEKALRTGRTIDIFNR